jgi:8-oxo-dGTP diphosphatase
MLPRQAVRRYPLRQNNGLGGKVEANEDVVTGARRETLGSPAYRLSLTLGELCSGRVWPRRTRLVRLIFRPTYDGTPHDGNDEGTLEWVALASLPMIPMWDSDHEWLPMVFDDDPRQFHGVMPYQEGRMVSWSYQRL